MNGIDWWSEPPKAIKVEKKVEPLPIKKKNREDKKKLNVDLSSLYVVTAGINKLTGRQLYLSTYEDCDEWSISVVPSIMSKSRALKMMDMAQQFIDDNPKKYRNKPTTLVLESLENADIYKQVRCIIR